MMFDIMRLRVKRCSTNSAIKTFAKLRKICIYTVVFQE